MRDRYWSYFVSIKHKYFYYIAFQTLYSRINWCITAFLALTTLSCVAVWNIWDKIPIVWAMLICMSQVIQALFPKLPYNDLLISVKFIIPEVDSLLMDIEHDWLYIDIHKPSDDDILSMLHKYDQRYHELTNQFFSGTFLPDIQYCSKKAEDNCKNYFATNYQV